MVENAVDRARFYLWETRYAPACLWYLRGGPRNPKESADLKKRGDLLLSALLSNIPDPYTELKNVTLANAVKLAVTDAGAKRVKLRQLTFLFCLNPTLMEFVEAKWKGPMDVDDKTYQVAEKVNKAVLMAIWAGDQRDWVAARLDQLPRIRALKDQVPVENIAFKTLCDQCLSTREQSESKDCLLETEISIHTLCTKLSLKTDLSTFMNENWEDSSSRWVRTKVTKKVNNYHKTYTPLPETSTPTIPLPRKAPSVSVVRLGSQGKSTDYKRLERRAHAAGGLALQRVVFQ